MDVSRFLAVKVVVVIILEISLAAASASARGSAGFSGEAEVVAEASGLLQRLGEHLVFANIVVGDGTTREFHSLFEMTFGDLGNRVVVH